MILPVALCSSRGWSKINGRKCCRDHTGRFRFVDRIEKDGTERTLRFIFFPNSWVLAHVARTTEVAKILRDRGHEVAFAGEHENPRSYLHTCKQEGFQTIHCMEFDWPYIWNRFLKYGPWLAPWDILTHQKFAPLDRILDDQVQLIQREKPDMVVCDGTFSISTAAYITQTPMAGIMNAYYTHFYRPTSIFRPMIDIWDKVHLSRLRRRIYRKYNCGLGDVCRCAYTEGAVADDHIGFFPLD